MRDRTQGEPRSFTSLDGGVRLVIDLEEFDFHMDVATDADPKSICSVYTQVQHWGMEVLDDDEDPGSIVEDGGRTWVRRYLAPTYPDAERGSAVPATLVSALGLFSVVALTAADIIPLGTLVGA
jgi:hypothetical protein